MRFWLRLPPISLFILVLSFHLLACPKRVNLQFFQISTDDLRIACYNVEGSFCLRGVEFSYDFRRKRFLLHLLNVMYANLFFEVSNMI